MNSPVSFLTNLRQDRLQRSEMFSWNKIIYAPVVDNSQVIFPSYSTIPVSSFHKVDIAKRFIGVVLWLSSSL